MQPTVLEDAAFAGRRQDVTIPAGGVTLNATLTLPEKPLGLVIFAHGSGSSRFSPRNRYVAEVLNEHKLATCLMDLLTAKEEEVDRRTRHLRFDIPMLAERVADATRWIHDQPVSADLEVGLFGASTGAGAALIAAAQMPDLIGAVVSRGGRPDLAGEFLAAVKCPTLLIVGENDPEVIDLNQKALDKLNEYSQLDIVPHATHLFEEPGTLETAASLAAGWFGKYLRRIA